MGLFRNLKNKKLEKTVKLPGGMLGQVNPDFFPRGGGPRTITLPDGTVIPIRGGGSSCPALNEEVLLADQSWILAKDLKVGDEVATHLGSNKVTYIDVLKDKTQKEVIFTNGEKENSIVTSDTHPYYVENEQGFVEVKNLKIGDKVGEFLVKEIKDAGKGSVAHISIDEAQTYFLKAGDEAVLSHNKRPALPKTPRGPKGPTIGGLLGGGFRVPTGPGLPIKNPLDDFSFGGRRRGLGGLLGGRGGLFGNIRDRIKERIQDMRFRDPRFEDRRRRKGLAGLFGRVPEKLVSRMQDQVPFEPVSQPEMMPLQMMQPQLFGRPLEGISFSDINIENIPNLPDFSQGLPPETLETIQSNIGSRYMPDFPIQPRMMMVDGDVADKEDYEASTQSLIDFLNSDQEQVDFGFVRNLVKEIVIDPGRTISDKERQMLSDALERNPNILSDEELSIVSDQMMKGSGRTMSNIDSGRTISDIDRQIMKGYAGGGEVFPDLTGDGKVTQADILKGRGVFAEGDEVSMMMMEMEGDEEGMQEEAIKQLEAARPEFEMMQQLAQIVINLLEQGAAQEEIIAILQEQGLDEEDIQTLLEYVNEMMGQAEQVEMAEEDIGSQLAALG